MNANLVWYAGKRESHFGEHVTIDPHNPNTSPFSYPAGRNYMATITLGDKTDELGLHTYGDFNHTRAINRDGLYDIRNPRERPVLFWKPNKVSEENGIYVFETRYCREGEAMLPLAMVSSIPENLRNTFMRTNSADRPKALVKIAGEVAGSEQAPEMVIKKFLEFLQETAVRDETARYTLVTLAEEYRGSGKFRASQTGERDFYMGLCNSVGLPTKIVRGHAKGRKHATWVDVLVPTEDGVRLYPVDPVAGLAGNGHLLETGHEFSEEPPALKRLVTDMRNHYHYGLKIETAE